MTVNRTQTNHYTAGFPGANAPLDELEGSRPHIARISDIGNGLTVSVGCKDVMCPVGISYLSGDITNEAALHLLEVLQSWAASKGGDQ